MHSKGKPGSLLFFVLAIIAIAASSAVAQVNGTPNGSPDEQEIGRAHV